MQLLPGMLSLQLLLFYLLPVPPRNMGRLEQKTWKTVSEYQCQKYCLTQTWMQSTAMYLATARCLLLWRCRRSLILLYIPQLTLLTLSHLLYEVFFFTNHHLCETSQPLKLNWEKNCNTVFPGLSKWTWKWGIWGFSKWRLWSPPLTWIFHLIFQLMCGLVRSIHGSVFQRVRSYSYLPNFSYPLLIKLTKINL